MKRTIVADGRRVEYTLIQSPRTTVLFQALPEGMIRVYAPKYMRLRDIDQMVRERAGQLGEMSRSLDQRLEADRRAHPVTDGSPIMIEGVPHTISIRDGRRAGGEVLPGELRLTLPGWDPVAAEAMDADVRGLIRGILSEMALRRIRERVIYFAPRVGRQPGRITIREQKTRWGSCSSKGNLNFNWLLIFAPPQALDYVVIHELCHLYEFNHSPQFWARVERYQSDYALWRKWLRSGWTAALPVRVGG